MGQFVISYKCKTLIKGQAVADFIVEFTYNEELIIDSLKLLPPSDPSMSNSTQLPHLVLEIPIWVLRVNGASNQQGSKACLVLITLEGNIFEIALKFLFKASKNKSEYEVILTGLRIAKNLGADRW